MGSVYRDKKSFHEVVLTIKEKIEKYDLNKWKNIVKPEEETLYSKYFEELLNKAGNKEVDKENTKIDNSKDIISEKSKKGYEINKEFFDKISNKEKFYFLLNIKEMMETSWLLADKRLDGIKLEETSEPVNVQELINYSSILSDTTCAPPECDNINDKLIHQEYYPNYHFLNFVNIEEIHLSKLFQLQKYSTICFPPIITIQEYNNILVVDISCSTPSTTIYYRVNDEIKEQVYDANNKPKIKKRKKVNIYAWSVKTGFIKSRVSCISKSYQVEEDDVSLTNEMLNIEQLDKPSFVEKVNKDENTSDKPSAITNVFKNLGFLLSRKKEKSSESSSNGGSSSGED
ncbi:mediator of RNA polymerase II transcription subunit 4 [Plasmodium brasilianum]|uniref:Uncharacterized protein n=2 Tax=Plasmodium (Plasmodium) TaxID=418103 RepID=A0A1A8W6J0_PLAMA|nr:conserved Plasmodium protein, unknown function [Plasmodium malariae]KAI4836640.1 mediator of RNA polymerase II transcription subunit 4 [Plasmodium brasilianum]SBS88405.1 hypothetical protein PMALA_022510 [Plasmodium malariae]SCO93920.1 conserved Plasmodium protein, unknown function [Plasmodium malariae]